MSEWQDVNLGSTGQVVTGKTPSKDNPEDWGDDVLFITPSDYKNYGKKAYSSIRMLSQVGAARQGKRLLPQNSVLVTCIGSDMGKTVVNALPCVTNQQINAIIPNRAVVDSDYIYYLTKDLYEALTTLGGDGTAVPILNKSDFENIGVTIPCLPEQKAIAAVLSSLDDKIDLLHRQNKTLEQMAETLFRQWFIEDAGEDWDERPFSYYVDHLKINIKPADNPSCAYMHYSLPAFDTGMRPVFESGSEILSNKYGVEPWTILVSKLNPRFPRIWPIGELAGQNAICSTEFQVFKPKNEKLYGFLYFFLKSTEAKEELSMAASGTSGSHQRVKPEDILNLKIIISSTDDAENFSELVIPGIKRSMANLQQINTLEKLRNTLLPKLMSGEVRVISS